MKKYILSLIPFIIALGCYIAYSIIGSEVTSDGTLVEPFYLVGIAGICVLIGAVSLIICGIKTLTNVYKKKRLS